MKTNHSEKFLKQRRFLLVLPFLTMPFITLAFWSLGGGQAKEDANLSISQGMNKELPGAISSPESTDKMSMYDLSKEDSVPASQLVNVTTSDSFGNAVPSAQTPVLPGDPALMHQSTDPNEQRVRDRLALLESTMNTAGRNGTSTSVSRQQPTALKQDLDRLEKMMLSMSAAANEDPEMRQLDGMLEKIMDIQQPDRARQKLKELSKTNKGRVYAVDKPDAVNAVSLLERNEAAVSAEKKFSAHQSGRAAENRFYDLTNEQPEDFAETAIPAVVHQTQTLVSGGTLKMRLTEDIYVNGTLIPSGHFLFGTATIAGERLRVDINRIQYNKQVFPVSLTVHDLDALEGIRIPGAITRDAAKDGSDRALQNIQFMSLDPSLAAQAAGTGVEIAKGLFSKKAKLIRATVKQGHPILLVDTKNQ